MHGLPTTLFLPVFVGYFLENNQNIRKFNIRKYQKLKAR